jgi:hypothetical protein
MTDQTQISPTDARRLLDEAERVSRRAHDATRWPYVTFLLALGTSTSLGTLAMAVTEGSAFGLAYVGTLVVVFALILFFCVTIQGRRAFAWSRRWSLYIGAWAVTYLAAIAVVGWAHGNAVAAGVTSGLVFLVTVTCAAVEARR